MHPLRPVPSKITQISREFGVTTRALRFYEEQGLLSPLRQQQTRIYSRRDRVRLRLVLKGRRVGLDLRTIGDLLDVYDREGETAQMMKALPRLRAQMSVLEARRSGVDAAIEALRAAVTRLSRTLTADAADTDQDGNGHD
ncbi:MAG: transcriptional regulator [Caulobacter sp.]|nr:transcriptional regulator [Caulobacter sp.]